LDTVSNCYIDARKSHDTIQRALHECTCVSVAGQAHRYHGWTTRPTP